MDTKKLEEFTRKVKAGEITDFEPWFDEQDPETLQTLKQICIRHGALWVMLDRTYTASAAWRPDRN